MASFGKLDDEPMIFLPLYESFCLGGHILIGMPKGIERAKETLMLEKTIAQLEIHMIGNEEDDNKQYHLAICPCPPNHQLNIWIVTKIPCVFKFQSK